MLLYGSARGVKNGGLTPIFFNLATGELASP